ncbi:glycoside hydrolase [Nonomuraea phyllanthi]|uniref:C40 family peptidase n=1 Tax=Nonomuraea phyllanthi TaxID=2219224 RepID=UPI001294023C|nr:C40 family peptidase [Nonomuraea phyllanthi]QFY08242.1 glycoside hydrolase [Nonomuraea phyllanthi]
MTVTAGGLTLPASTAQAATNTTSTTNTPVGRLTGVTAGQSSTEAAGGSSSSDSAAKAVTTARASKSAKAASRKAARIARQKSKARKAVAVAKHQIGDPYRYGATGPGSFDCSGLVQFAWRKAGVKIPRVASSQFAGVKKKISWRHLKPGDLMFFNGLGHVGMYVGKGKMIHSPRTGERVRIDRLSGWRKSSFVGAVRPGA